MQEPKAPGAEESLLLRALGIFRQVLLREARPTYDPAPMRVG